MRKGKRVRQAVIWLAGVVFLSGMAAVNIGATEIAKTEADSALPGESAVTDGADMEPGSAQSEDSGAGNTVNVETDSVLPGEPVANTGDVGAADAEIADLYSGTYVAGDGSTVTIRKNAEAYSVELSIIRLTQMNDGLSEYVKERKMLFYGTDAAGNPIGSMITWSDDYKEIKMTFVDSTWTYLPNGTELYFQREEGLSELSAAGGDRAYSRSGMHDLLWYYGHWQYYLENSGAWMEIWSQNDAFLQLHFTSGNVERIWTFAAEPSRIGVSGELIYESGSETFTYYPDDHHIYFDTLSELFRGVYWLSEDFTYSYRSPEDFAGSWYDSYSQRCGLTISCLDGLNYDIDIHWSSSAWESTEWAFTGRYDQSKGGIVYSGTKYRAVYNDDGSSAREIVYTDGKGVLCLNSADALYWRDFIENDGENCIFLNENTYQVYYEPAYYILPDSDCRYLTSDDVRYLSLQQINYAKNEIYARHGRKFQSWELQNYFNSQSWYYGWIEPEDFSTSVFNSYESANVKYLSDLEFSIAPNGYQLDQ